MDTKDVVLQVGLDIEKFTLDDLEKAIVKLRGNPMYADDLINTINSGEQKEIGASLFMWLCRYLELEIINTQAEIEPWKGVSFVVPEEN